MCAAKIYRERKTHRRLFFIWQGICFFLLQSDHKWHKCTNIMLIICHSWGSGWKGGGSENQKPVFLHQALDTKVSRVLTSTRQRIFVHVFLLLLQSDHNHQVEIFNENYSLQFYFQNAAVEQAKTRPFCHSFLLGIKIS